MESGEWWCTFVKFPSEIFNNLLSRIQKDFKKPKKWVHAQQKAAAFSDG
jgi:hypothetical protein